MFTIFLIFIVNFFSFSKKLKSESESSDLDDFVLNEDEENNEYDDESITFNDYHERISQQSINLETAKNIRIESDRYLLDNNIDFKNVDYSKDNYLLPSQGKKNSIMLWSTKQPQSNKRLKKDVLKLKPGLTVHSKDVESFLECFRLFISDDITSLILKYTNQALEIHRLKENRSNDKLFEEIRREEFLAYCGLLLTMGLNRDNKTPLDRLWSTDELLVGCIYNLVISRQRFKVIHRFIRFDNILTSDERKKDNKLAKVSEMMEIFNNNCQRSLNTGETVTIDEQLLKFYGKVKFQVYMPTKPAKYGVKSKNNLLNHDL